MKGLGNTKLVFFHQPNIPLCKQQQQQQQQSGSLAALLGSHQHRLLIVAVISFFTLASLFTLLTTTTSSSSKPLSPHTIRTTTPTPAAPPILSDALVHYAASAASAGAAAGSMSEPDLRAIASAIRLRAPCNLLLFGLGHETLLWRSLNHGGRTVVLDENEYYIAHFEQKHPDSIEAYDVAYTTKVGDLAELLNSTREHLGDECRPVQNLLFSDCRLGINDLPNQLYDVPWDVILVDGPRGYAPTAPGRMSAIFTAAVMARTTGRGGTDVLVHDYEREVERVCSEEFLCPENLVSATGQLAHFVIRGGGGGADGMKGFCKDDRNGTLPADATTTTAGTGRGTL